MAIHIRNRNDLIKWLEDNAPTRAIRRSVLEGQVENLGAFENIVFGIYPGWVVKVISRHKKIWNIIIYVHYHTKELLCFNSNWPVFWSKWIGDQYQNKLYQGDNPELYKELKKCQNQN